MEGDPVVHGPTGYRIRVETLVPSGIRLRADEPLVIGRGVTVEGGIFLAGSIYTEPRVKVHGPLHVGGRVVLGARSIVAGGIEAASDVRVLPQAQVQGGIRTPGDVHLYDGAAVQGPIRAGGDIVIWGGAEGATLRPTGRVRTEPFPRARPA